jgi:hypothetical protein
MLLTCPVAAPTTPTTPPNPLFSLKPICRSKLHGLKKSIPQYSRRCSGLRQRSSPQRPAPFTFSLLPSSVLFFPPFNFPRIASWSSVLEHALLIPYSSNVFSLRRLQTLQLRLLLLIHVYMPVQDVESWRPCSTWSLSRDSMSVLAFRFSSQNHLLPRLLQFLLPRLHSISRTQP